jgi:hypothetical protein
MRFSHVCTLLYANLDRFTGFTSIQLSFSVLIPFVPSTSAAPLFILNPGLQNTVSYIQNVIKEWTTGKSPMMRIMIQRTQQTDPQKMIQGMLILSGLVQNKIFCTTYTSYFASVMLTEVVHYWGNEKGKQKYPSRKGGCHRELCQPEILHSIGLRRTEHQYALVKAVPLDSGPNKVNTWHTFPLSEILFCKSANTNIRRWLTCLSRQFALTKLAKIKKKCCES